MAHAAHSRPEDVARELVAIQERLASMASDPAAPGRDMAAEIREIRDDLRRLATQNDEIRARLGPLLWDEPAPDE